MQSEIYTLPEISIVGGSTTDLRFYLKDGAGVPYDASDYSIFFAVCNYAGKQADPQFTCAASLDEDDETHSALNVTISSENTLNRYGKYVYQITFLNQNSGERRIPGQGILNITKNIHQSAGQA